MTLKSRIKHSILFLPAQIDNYVLTRILYLDFISLRMINLFVHSLSLRLFKLLIQLEFAIYQNYHFKFIILSNRKFKDTEGLQMDKNNSTNLLKKNFDHQIIFHDDFDHQNSPKNTLNVKEVANSPKYKTIPNKEGIFQNYQDTIQQINPKHPEINPTLKNSVSEENMRNGNLLNVQKTQEVRIKAKNNSEHVPLYNPETQRARKHRSVRGEKSTQQKLKEMVQKQIEEREKWQQNGQSGDLNFKTIQSPHNTNDLESLKKITSSQKLGKLNDQKFAATNLQKNEHFQQNHHQDGDYIAPIQKQVKQQKIIEQDKKKKTTPQIQALKKKASTYEVLNQHDLKSGSVMISLADKQTPSVPKPHPKNKPSQFPKPRQPKTRIIGIDIKDLSSFAKSPLPNTKYIQCNVNRDCSCIGKALFPEYSIQIDEISALHAKKTIKGYDIFVSNLQDGNNIPLSKMQKVASVKGNLLGSYFNIFDGQNNDQIIATVYYNSEMTTKSIVRDIQLYVKVGDLVPVYDGSEMDTMAVYYSRGVDLKTLYGMMEAGNSRKIEKYISKMPNYNAQTKMYTLDFGTRRVSMPSVNNVVLVNAEDESQRGLVFGKSGYNSFYLRIDSPLSPIIAMGYLMTSFEFKWVTQ